MSDTNFEFSEEPIIYSTDPELVNEFMARMKSLGWFDNMMKHEVLQPDGSLVFVSLDFDSITSHQILDLAFPEAVVLEANEPEPFS